MYELLKFFIKYLYYKLFGGLNSIGWRVAFESGVVLKNRKYISLGNSIYLGKNVVLQVPEEHVDHGNHDPKIIIEDKVTIGMSTMISVAKAIRIGKNVLIAPYCYITDHNHKYTDVTVPIRYQGLDKVKEVVIKENAWIGANAVITSGVTVGIGSVVGANSVVTKDVPDYSVAVGVPARVIKRYDFALKKWVRAKLVLVSGIWFYYDLWGSVMVRVV